MRKIKLWLWLPLAVVLTLVVAVAAGLYLNRITTLEYLVSTFTDYRLSLNGSVDFELGANGAGIKLSRAVLRSAENDDPLLTAEQFELAVELLGLTTIKVSELKVSNAEIKLSKLGDGNYNWPLPSGDRSSGKINWNKRFGTLQLENIKLLLSGFTKESVQLDIARLEVGQNNNQRELSLQAQLNQFPIELSASLENVSALILDPKPVKLTAQGHIDTIKIKATGDVGIDPNQTDLLLSVEAKDSSVLANLLDLQLPQVEHLSASATLQQPQAGYLLRNIDVSIASPGLSLTATGEATRLDELELALKVSLASPDVGKLSSIDALAQWSGWAVNLATEIRYSHAHGRFVNTRFTATDNKRQIDLTAQALQLKHSGSTISEIQASNAELAYQFYDDRPNSQAWQYQYQADTLSAVIAPNQDMQLKTRGHYKNMPVTADGVWEHSGDYHFTVGLDQANATVKGYLRDEVFKIDGELTTTTLQPLADLINEAVVPVDQATLSIGFLVSKNNMALSHLDLSMLKGDSTLHINGSIDKLSTLDGLGFKVNITAGQLDQLNHWISSSSLIVDRTLSDLADPTSFASTGDVAYRKSLPISSPWLSELMQQLDLKSWLDDYPNLDGKTQVNLTVKGTANTTVVNISRFDLKSPMAAIQWSGQVTNGRNLFDLKGQLRADLKQGAIETLATPALITTRTDMNNKGPLRLGNFHALAGKSELNAELELSINDGLQAASGKVAFQTLDLLPYFPELETDQNQNQNQDKDKDKDKKNETGAPIFSSEDFPLKWLPDYQLNIDFSATEMISPWFKATSLNSHIANKHKVFSLSSTSWKIGEADVHALFKIDSSQATPAASLYLRSKNYNPSDVELSFQQDLLKKGTVSVLIQIDGEGKNEKQLAASLNGKISIVSRDTILQGDQVDQMAPTVIKEINEKINPFYDKDQPKDTELQCGVIHFDLVDGLMTADKSIILVTPNIIIGAHGAIDLKNETLRMQFIPRTRKGLGLSISGTFADMAVVDGPLSHPGISFDAYGAITTGARDTAGTILLGPLYWLYLGQAQKFLASPKACEDVIDKVAPQFAVKPTEKNTD